MEKVVLGKYVKIKTGKLDVNASAEDGKYPFFTCAREISRINEYAFDCEAVLVAGNGELNVKYYEGKFNAYQRTYIIESLDKLVLSVKYLFYFLDSYIEKLRNGAIGGVIKYIKLSHLTDIDFPLPNLEIQNKIVTVLDKAKTILDKREETIKKYDELMRATFFDMFGDVVNNPKGLPKGTIKELGSVITGNTPPRSEKANYDSNFIEWVKTDNILPNIHLLSKASEYLSETGFAKSRYVDENALLVTCIAGSIGSIGRSAISDRRVAFNQQINAIVPNANVSVYFLYWIFKASAEYIQSFATGGMKRLLTKGEFEKISLLKPSYEQQIEFERIAVKYGAFKLRLLFYRNTAENLVNSFSQQVFSESANIDVDVELESLINAIELDNNDKDNRIDTVKNDLTFMQRLIDKMQEQDFENADEYEKAKYIIFRILKEEPNLIKQRFIATDKKIMLQLQ